MISGCGSALQREDVQQAAIQFRLAVKRDYPAQSASQVGLISTQYHR